MAPTARQNVYMSLLKWGVLQSRVEDRAPAAFLSFSWQTSLHAALVSSEADWKRVDPPLRGGSRSSGPRPPPPVEEVLRTSPDPARVARGRGAERREAPSEARSAERGAKRLTPPQEARSASPPPSRYAGGGRHASNDGRHQASCLYLLCQVVNLRVVKASSLSLSLSLSRTPPPTPQTPYSAYDAPPGVHLRHNSNPPFETTKWGVPPLVTWCPSRPSPTSTCPSFSYQGSTVQYVYTIYAP